MTSLLKWRQLVLFFWENVQYLAFWIRTLTVIIKTTSRFSRFWFNHQSETLDENRCWHKFSITYLFSRTLLVEPVVSLPYSQLPAICVIPSHKFRIITIKQVGIPNITAAEMKYIRKTAECSCRDNKTHKGFAKEPSITHSFWQYTGIEKKLVATYKQYAP